MEIKTRRVDNLIVVVADSVLTLELGLDEDIDGFYQKVQNIAYEINSGLLEGDDLKQRKLELMDMMNPIRRYVPEIENTESAEAEAYELAGKDKKLMKRVASISDDFEYDMEGYTYLKGFGTPIPKDLADALLDAHYNKDSRYTVESLVNFWQWALLNPNPLARNDLFKWFRTGKFSITDTGLVIAYRYVIKKKEANLDMPEKLIKFVEESYTKIKSWKRNPKQYYVVSEGDEYSFRKSFLGFTPKNHHGNIEELHTAILENEEGDIFTDGHTRTMTIKIGEEVSMPREDCDEDRNAQCSSGLHFMSKKYGGRFGDTALVVLVNPMNIVAFPNYDQTKGRCCAYMPIAKAVVENGQIKEFDQGTYEFEYSQYTKDYLENLLGNEGLSSLQERGLLSEQLTEEDMISLRNNLTSLLKDKLVHVE